jgi:hypothetical protein
LDALFLFNAEPLNRHLSPPATRHRKFNLKASQQRR